MPYNGDVTSSNEIPQEFIVERERKRLAAIRRRQRIEARLAKGETVRQVAESEGVSTQMIYKVLRRGS